jgi:hypothetical protein
MACACALRCPYGARGDGVKAGTDAHSCCSCRASEMLFDDAAVLLLVAFVSSVGRAGSGARADGSGASMLALRGSALRLTNTPPRAAPRRRPPRSRSAAPSRCRVAPATFPGTPRGPGLRRRPAAAASGSRPPHRSGPRTRRGTGASTARPATKHRAACPPPGAGGTGPGRNPGKPSGARPAPSCPSAPRARRPMQSWDGLKRPYVCGETYTPEV